MYISPPDVTGAALQWRPFFETTALIVLVAIQAVNAMVSAKRTKKSEQATEEVRITLANTTVAAEMAAEAVKIKAEEARASAEHVKLVLLEVAERQRAKEEQAIVDAAVTGKKLDAIHTMVNGEHAYSLRMLASALERIAIMTQDLGDLQRAQDARKASLDHDAKQRVLKMQGGD